MVRVFTLSKRSEQVEALRSGIDVLIRVFKIADRLDIPEVEVRLNPPDTLALLFIAEHPNCISGDVGQLLSVAPTTTSTIIDRLVKHNLVKRNRTESNRRVVLLCLTEKGQETAQLILNEQRQHCETMLDALPRESRSMFVDCVKTIAKSIG